MNQEDMRRIGVDIDEISLEADRLSRKLGRIAGQFGVKTPKEPVVLTERDRETIREALHYRLTTSYSVSQKTEIMELLRRMAPEKLISGGF